MEARYRRDYPGEFVILNTTWEGGKRTEQREWIANPIENQHISGRAVCIGSRDSLNDPYPWGIDYKILQRHRGGLLGTLKLQTYGTGEIATDMRLDFCVETNSTALAEIINNKYYENNIVYTTARNCIDNPGDFYLIPQNPRLLLASLPVYLAAFDGHQEIFLIGYHCESQFGHDRWVDELKSLFNAYAGVKFWIVIEPTRMPEAWRDCANVVPMPYRDFVGYADV
jgi:hypothetical protein